jgi:hypothetical protein
VLPTNLLIARRRKGRIWPRYAKLSKENLDAANLLIKAYAQHKGQKKKTIKKIASKLEHTAYDYRFIRGLSTLLERRSTFKCNTKINPINLRRNLYQETAKHWPPTTPEQRKKIVESVVAKLKLTAEAIEESLYADLDNELILTEFNPLPPQELIKNYNLSLTQTLIFNSTELNFTTSGNWQTIFFTIKRLGLIYEAHQNNTLWVKIDGPASLFKLTRKYGTAIAKLIPTVIVNPKWTIKAKILWKYTNEICNFKIQSRNHNTILKTTQPYTPSYDSTVEENFANRFKALKTKWHLKREPEPIPTGKHVIIPDFSFERENTKIYMEIVGFWTTEYLKQKIKKLKQTNENILVAVDETLACQKLTNLQKHKKLDILYYRKKVPLTPILRHLEKAFRQVQTKQTTFVKNLPIKFMEPIVDYEEFAQRIGVTTEAVRTALTEKPPNGYTALPNLLVKKEKLKQIRKKLEEQINHTGKLPLPQAVKTIETEGAKDASIILKSLGYKIEWHGISPETAKVTKPETKPSN